MSTSSQLRQRRWCFAELLAAAMLAALPAAAAAQPAAAGEGPVADEPAQAPPAAGFYFEWGAGRPADTPVAPEGTAPAYEPDTITVEVALLSGTPWGGPAVFTLGDPATAAWLSLEYNNAAMAARALRLPTLPTREPPETRGALPQVEEGGVVAPPTANLLWLPPGPLGLNPTGAKTTRDAVAGLTTILAPQLDTIGQMRQGAARQQVAYLRPVIEGNAQTWPQRDFEFAWPEGRPRYYLERVEEDLYRRVELADKEGYTVALAPSGPVEGPTVDVTLTRNTLGGGKYDDTIHTLVGPPVLIKTVLTTSVPLAAGQRTLLIWRPQPEGQTAAVDALYQLAERGARRRMAVAPQAFGLETAAESCAVAVMLTLGVPEDTTTQANETPPIPGIEPRRAPGGMVAPMGGGAVTPDAFFHEGARRRPVGPAPAAPAPAEQAVR